METPLSNRLIELLPAIKSRWEILLKTELDPAPSPGGVVTPDMLVLMLDNTLARLLVRVAALPASTARALPRKSHHKKQRDNCCRCGLHLLTTYYLAGAQALRTVLPREMRNDRILVSNCLNRLAHEEIDGLASLCHFNGSANCSLPPAERPAPTGKTSTT
ncbi:MAG: hypothetical protein ABI273_22135 [Lacunisphaera sp.]